MFHSMIKDYKQGDTCHTILEVVDEDNNVLTLKLGLLELSEDDISDLWMEQRYWDGATFVDEGPSTQRIFNDWVDTLEQRYLNDRGLIG